MCLLSATLALLLLTCALVTSETYDGQGKSLISVPRDNISLTVDIIDLSLNNINSIEDTDFINLPNLRTIKINSNNISFVSPLAFRNSTHITEIHMQMNQVCCISHLSSLGNQLEVLLLDKNPLDPVEADDLLGFSALRLLSIIKTNQHSYPNTTHVANTLKSLYLNENPLSTVNPVLLTTTPQLSELKVSECGLSHFPDFSLNPMNTVIKIDLVNAYVALADVDRARFDNLPLIKFLTLSKAQLTEFPDLGLAKTNLKHLLLSSNQISSVDPARLQGMPMLTWLVMDNNLLTSFPDMNGYGLTLLDLRNNQLICASSTAWIGQVINSNNITNFHVVDPCLDQDLFDYVGGLTKSDGPGVFVRITEGDKAWMSQQVDELSACMCQCVQETDCMALSFQVGAGCVFVRQSHATLSDLHQWWNRTM